MRLQVFLISVLTVPGFVISNTALPWGEEGHRIIGEDALNLLDTRARIAVEEILSNGPDQAIGETCNWPDRVRKTSQWEWSALLHYVNIPRKSRHYDRQRDCPDGLCVTEGIIRYANELTRTGLDSTRRWQALAWVCHLVGDLHQPLHAGYEDDLGGNLVQIEYRGEAHNLHQFWDRVVIMERLGMGDRWERVLGAAEWQSPAISWNPRETALWADESHILTASSAYPPDQVIQEEFADQTWLIVRKQWQKSSIRLAQVLKATLGAGEVVLD
jgi:hypothetical protein